MAFIENNDTDFEWIPLAWIRKWLSDKLDEKIPEIDNAPFLCSHDKLDPAKVACVKCVRQSAANLLFQKYGGKVRLKRYESFCWDCVRGHCQRIQFQSRLLEDQKVIAKSLKTGNDCCEGFWVGKRSLRIWKQLVNKGSDMKPIPEVIKENGYHEEEKDGALTTTVTDPCKTDKNDSVEQNGREINEKTESSTSLSEVQEDDEDEEEEEEEFNEDILCEHGKLTTDASSRRLIPENVWSRLHYYFPSCPEFSHLEEGCATCRFLDEEELAKEMKNRTQALEQKNLLSPLYHERNRPQVKDIGLGKIHVISKKFLDEWRQFIRQQGKGSPPEMILNADLLCPHSLFSFSPLLCGTDGADDMLCYIWEHEWGILSRFYHFDLPITVFYKITIGDDDDNDTSQQISSIPDFCAECHQARIFEKSNHVQDYRGAVLYVRKITGDHTNKDIQNILSMSESSCKRTEEGLEDPDFEGLPKKKQRLMSPENPQRRSIRHRKQRGEVELKVDSSQTLREIKLLLMKQFSVMPMDQHLSFNRRILTDDQATLGSIGIHPGSLLLLKVDEPQTEVSEQELLQAASTPEEGFKGTGLLGRTQP